jgi:hypothetical protein
MGTLFAVKSGFPFFGIFKRVAISFVVKPSQMVWYLNVFY